MGELDVFERETFTPWYNMAVDVWLLENIPPRVAAIRFFDWKFSTISFGYTLKYHDAVNVYGTHNEKLVFQRRPTGGGIVDHRTDWTYSIVLGSEVPISKESPSAIYLWIHSLIKGVLDAMGVPCSIHEEVTGPAGHLLFRGKCPEQAVRHDLLDGSGLKIAGAGLKRTRLGVLIQGSLWRLHDLDVSKEAFDQSLSQAVANSLRIKIAEKPSVLLDTEGLSYLASKYKSSNWNRRR